MKKIAIAILAGFAALASGTASAALVTGGFSIGNNPGGYVTTDFGTGSVLTFTPGAPSSNLVNSIGISAKGDFAGTAPLDLNVTTYSGVIQNVASATFGPVASFFTLGADIVFDLTSLKLGAVGAMFVGGFGTGVLKVTGFDPTPATLTFSTQSVGSSNNTWSASIGVIDTPEIDAFAATSALTLLGFSLALAGGRRRRRG